jgi:hypothetical protein
MIFDRTYADVINAKNILLKKVQKGVTLTESEETTLERGFLRMTTISRIVDALKGISDEIKSIYGYDVGLNEVDVSEWTPTKIFTYSNFDSMIVNILKIIGAFEALDVSDKVDSYREEYGKITREYSYTNLNRIEKIIYDLQNDVKSLKSSWTRVYTFGVTDPHRMLEIYGAYSAEKDGGVLRIE